MNQYFKGNSDFQQRLDGANSIMQIPTFLSNSTKPVRYIVVKSLNKQVKFSSILNFQYTIVTSKICSVQK